MASTLHFFLLLLSTMGVAVAYEYPDLEPCWNVTSDQLTGPESAKPTSIKCCSTQCTVTNNIPTCTAPRGSNFTLNVFFVHSKSISSLSTYSTVNLGTTNMTLTIRDNVCNMPYTNLTCPSTANQQYCMTMAPSIPPATPPGKYDINLTIGTTWADDSSTQDSSSFIFKDFEVGA